MTAVGDDRRGGATTENELVGGRGRPRSRGRPEGLARRAAAQPTAISVDETAFARRYEYVTVVSADDGALHVVDGRGQAALEACCAAQDTRTLEGLRTVAMDMWTPWIQVTQACVADPNAGIAFDRFRVAQYLGAAVDQVLRREHKAVRVAGDDSLKRTRHLWLRSPGSMSSYLQDALARCAGRT